MQHVPFTGILGPTYTLDSLNAECQRCVNMYLEKIESGAGKEAYWLKPTPGLRAFIELDEGPVRAIYTASNGRVFAVGGANLYELGAGGTADLMGTMDSATGKIRCVDNGLILYLVYGTTAYRFKFADDTLTKVTDPNYLGGNFVKFLDQYFLTNIPGSQQFQISPLSYDGTTPYSAGDVFSAESVPDYITAMEVNGRELWLFGPNSYEVWFNTGDGVRPFQRIRDAAVNIGTAAPYSVLSVGGRVLWLGGSKEGFGSVWASNGYQPTRVSNYAIEGIIRSFQTVDDAEAWSYQVGGHLMYVLTFPTDARTLVYDLTEDQWHEMDYRVPLVNLHIQHRGICHGFGFNKNLVGDFANGTIYELTPDVYTDNGDPIIRLRRSPHTQKRGPRTFYHYFELDAQVGVGLVTGQGSDPLVNLRISDDGANTWGNYHTLSLGRIGKYRTRVRWSRLGASYDRVFELTISEPVPFNICGATLGVTNGVH